MNYFKKYLTPTQKIFKNIKYLDPECLPHTFHHREQEMNTIANKISPIFYGSVPSHTIILGANATGKTTAIKMLLKDITETITDIYPVYINCREHYTEYKIYSKIYQEILHTTPPGRGISNQKIFEDIIHTLQQEHKTLIIALDDINYLLDTEDNTASPVGQKVIRNFMRANETYHVVIGLFPILTNAQFKYKFDHELESTFIPSEVWFKPYTREQVHSICRERCNYAFNVFIPDSVLDVVVDEVLEHDNLRLAWKLLKDLGLRMGVEEKEASVELLQQVIDEVSYE